MGKPRCSAIDPDDGRRCARASHRKGTAHKHEEDVAPRGGRKTETRGIHLTADEWKRVQAMASRSEMGLDEWIRLAVMSSCYVDEAHWEEMSRREEIVRTIDRLQFGQASLELRNLGEGTKDTLVGILVREREKGREEGAQSALRLAVVRRTGDRL